MLTYSLGTQEHSLFSQEDKIFGPDRFVQLTPSYSLLYTFDFSLLIVFQFNPESNDNGGDVKIINNGANLWILGLKTEGLVR